MHRLCLYTVVLHGLKMYVLHVLPSKTFHTWILYMDGRGNLWLKVLSFSTSVKKKCTFKQNGYIESYTIKNAIKQLAQINFTMIKACFRRYCILNVGGKDLMCT